MTESKKAILLVVLVIIAVGVIAFSVKSYMAQQPREAYHVKSQPGQISPKQAEVNAMNAEKSGNKEQSGNAPAGPGAGN